MITNYLKAKNGIEILHEDGITQILAGGEDPSIHGRDASIGSLYLQSIDDGKTFRKVGELSTDWEYQETTSTSGTPISFVSLTDTPNSYTNQIGKYPRVNASGNGLEFNAMEFDPVESPLIPETAISGTYFVNFEGARLLRGNVGNKPDLVFNGPVCGLAFNASKIESCYASFKVPYAWNTDSDIKVTINFINDNSQIGNKVCSWRIGFHSYKEYEIYQNKTTTVVEINYSLGNNAQAGTFHVHTLVIPKGDINNPIERGDVLCFRFYREGSDNADTMVGDAILVALMIELQTGQNVMIGGI